MSDGKGTLVSDLGGELRNQMGFNPNKRKVFKSLKGIPPFKVAHWISLPSFVFKYNTQIRLPKEETIYKVQITITKNRDCAFADVSFNGCKFGELHCGTYRAGDEQRSGPNFVPKISAEDRKKFFGGHITPWTSIMPANIFLKNAFNSIMSYKFVEGVEPFAAELSDSSIIPLKEQQQNQESAVEG